MKDLMPGIKNWFSKAFNLPILQNNRMPWVDYLRGIAILLVVYRHALIGIERSGKYIPEYLADANMVFYSFRMPLFFIVSGIFISGSLAKKKVGQLIFFKFENLLYPYFIWTFIQVTLQIILAKYVNSERELKDYAYIFYEPRALDQFWYLPTLFNVTVIYLLIKTKLKPKPWVQILLGLIFYFLSPYVVGMGSIFPDWMGFYLFFAMGDTISSFFFKDSSQRFLKNPYTLLLIIPFFAATQVFYLSQPEKYYRAGTLGQVEFLIIALVGCLSMFVLAFRFQQWKLFPFLRVLGFHSLYIYVMHVLVIGFMRMILTKFLHISSPPIILSCSIFLGVTIPVIFYNLFIRNNVLWFLFSFRKSKPVSPKVKEVTVA
jgi:fucose 4-O-acetylase-like acetyltransferase